MLWYKAWLETRSRFLISLVGITAVCSYVVFHGDRNGIPYPGTTWYHGVLIFANNILVLTWLAAVTMLSMGGLLREKSAGASTFTLALPVGRTTLLVVRIATVLAQSVLLVIIPWTAMYLIDGVFGKVHSMQQALFRIVLVLGGGLIFVALSILVSSLVEGEYTAPVVGLGLIIVISLALFDPPLRAYNPYVFMTGSEYLHKPTMMLVGPIPWMHVAANLLVGALVLVLAVRSIRKRDLT